MAKKKPGRKMPVSRMDQKKKPEKKQSQTGKIVAGVVVAAVIAVAVILFAGSQGDEEAASQFVSDLDPSRGPADAAVVIQEFADFGCAHCKDAQPVIDQLLSEYPDDLRVEFENMVLPASAFSNQTAKAAECAFEQSEELYFELEEMFFEKQEQWTNLGSESFVREYAEEAGLEMNEYDTCYEGNEAQRKIDDDIAEGRQLAVSSTPTFFVDGERIVGGSYVEMKAIIDKALAE